MSQLSHESSQTTSSTYKFKCSLAFVLVDGKQIASGDAAADLVIKTEATQSPASASRQAGTSSPTRYTLLVYVAKEVEPKISLPLDAFIAPSTTATSPATMRHSDQRRRLLVKAQSGVTSNPMYDFRFSRTRDLQEAVSRLSRLGIRCDNDDADAAPPRSQSSTGLPRHTPSPHFILSPDMMKAGRVLSPLQRRPDGSTPPFMLMRVSSSKISNSGVSSQDTGSQGSTASLVQNSQESMPPPESEPIKTFRPASVPVRTRRNGHSQRLETITASTEIRTSTQPTTRARKRLPELLAESEQERPDIPDFPLSNSPSDTTVATAPVGQPVKRRRTMPRSQQSAPAKREALAEIPHHQGQATESSRPKGREIGQEMQTMPTAEGPALQTNRTERIYQEAEVQVDIQQPINAAMLDRFWARSMYQLNAWESLREALVSDVEHVADDDTALELLVEKYQRDLNEQIGNASIP